jgi:hypothetical protein
VIARKQRKAAPRKRPANVRYVSRCLLLQLLSDFCARTENQRQALDAIAATNTPNGLHTVAEHRVRTVTGILLESQLSGLRDIEGFARIVRNRAGPPGDDFTRNQPV